MTDHEHKIHSFRLIRILLCAGLLFFAVGSPSRAQSGWFSQPPACSAYNRNESGIDSLEAWAKGKELAGIEGDGAFGIGNMGHTKEALEWYCRASAAGNAVATYEIADIVREGYVVNSEDDSGRIITQHFDPDLAAAFGWYQRSADGGFTKAMLRIAQYYGLGNQVLTGSNVPTDLSKSLYWLRKAAEGGDTTALQILASRYAGLRTALWAMNLAIAPDSGKAFQSLNSARAAFQKRASMCSSPESVRDFVDRLPEASAGRQVKGASIIEVHGVSDSYPMEIDCMLRLSGPPPSQQQEPLLDQFQRLASGGGISSWVFSVTQIPGVQGAEKVRETATQATVEGMQQLAILLQTIVPPDGSHSMSGQTPVFNLAGMWHGRK